MCSLIVFRICAVRLFFVSMFMCFSGLEMNFPVRVETHFFFREGVVWRTRVCGPACCQMAVLYRKPTVSLPARQEPTPGCKQSQPGRT